MVSNHLAFVIGWLVFLIALAVIVYRLIWLERVRTDSRSAQQVSPASSRPEWERDDPSRPPIRRPRINDSPARGDRSPEWERTSGAIGRGRAEWNE